MRFLDSSYLSTSLEVVVARNDKKTMSTYQTLGIILKKTDFGEADQLLNIYTQSHGKIIALGKGTKKIQSKLSSGLQYFSLINLMVAWGKNYDHIAGVELARIFSGIAIDLKKIILASYALELVDQLTKPNQPDIKIFTLLSKYLLALNDNSFTFKEWQIVRQAFVVKLLTILGFQPPKEIIAEPNRIDVFLKQNLDLALRSENFFSKIKLV